jgi:hypothetical protein
MIKEQNWLPRYCCQGYRQRAEKSGSNYVYLDITRLGKNKIMKNSPIFTKNAKKLD